MKTPIIHSQQQIVETPKADKLLRFQEVNLLIGSRCRTSHSVRALVLRGLIKAIHMGPRVTRYSENSVLALIRGESSTVLVARKEDAK